jgi:Dual OB-containing domain
MPLVKQLVCLANSRKLSGRCVAGKELIKGQAGVWVRPVSARPSEEVSEQERQYSDGTDPRVLDVINIPLLEKHPKLYQVENWLLDPDSYWEFVGRMTWHQLTAMADTPSILWLNTSSTHHGQNDRVALADAKQLHCSLYLLHLSMLSLRIFAPGVDFGNAKRRVQAIFQYNAIEYRLWVTDPVIEREYLAKPDAMYPLGECCVTVSLGEPDEDGFCYKLVAALITPGRAEG